MTTPTLVVPSRQRIRRAVRQCICFSDRSANVLSVITVGGGRPGVTVSRIVNLALTLGVYDPQKAFDTVLKN